MKIPRWYTREMFTEALQKAFEKGWQKGEASQPENSADGIEMCETCGNPKSICPTPIAHRRPSRWED